jgi:hypothetical protein
LEGIGKRKEIFGMLPTAVRLGTYLSRRGLVVTSNVYGNLLVDAVSAVVTSRL